MILKYNSPSESIIANTDVASSNVTAFASYRIRTATTLVPFTKYTDITDTPAATIVPSPSASGESHYIDQITFKNRELTSRELTIFWTDGTQFAVIWEGTLEASESVQYNVGTGWIVMTSTGVIKAVQNAAGSDMEIQFNNNGVLSGHTDFAFESSSDTLKLTGSDANILLTDRTTDPSTPSAGRIALWAKKIAGRSMLKQMGEGGIDTPFQNAFFQNNIVQWRPTTAAAGVYEGTIGSNLGTPAAVLPTVTNLATMMRRSTFPSVVTTANQQVGIRTEAMFFRGNATNLGGFFFVCRFMFATWTAGNRLFVGLCSGTTAVVTVNPSGLLNMLGFGVDAGETAITFMHNDGVGTCTKDTITGQPALATNQGYIAYIFAKPNDSTVYYRLDDVNLQNTIIDTSTSSDLPVNTTGLTAQCIMGNAANVVAGNATIGVNCLYVETDI